MYFVARSCVMASAFSLVHAHRNCSSSCLRRMFLVLAIGTEWGTTETVVQHGLCKERGLEIPILVHRRRLPSLFLCTCFYLLTSRLTWSHPVLRREVSCCQAGSWPRSSLFLHPMSPPQDTHPAQTRLECSTLQPVFWHLCLFWLLSKWLPSFRSHFDMSGNLK